MERSQYSDEHKAFQRLLRAARQEAGVSQEVLAARLGQGSRQGQLLVSRSELGHRKVDVVELWHYCEALGVSFPDFARRLDAELRALRPASSVPTSPSSEAPVEAPSVEAQVQAPDVAPASEPA